MRFISMTCHCQDRITWDWGECWGMLLNELNSRHKLTLHSLSRLSCRAVLSRIVCQQTFGIPWKFAQLTLWGEFNWRRAVFIINCFCLGNIFNRLSEKGSKVDSGIPGRSKAKKKISISGRKDFCFNLENLFFSKTFHETSVWSTLFSKIFSGFVNLKSTLNSPKFARRSIKLIEIKFPSKS